MTLKRAVWTFLEKHPEFGIREVRAQFPDAHERTLKNYISDFRAEYRGEPRDPHAASKRRTRNRRPRAPPDPTTIKFWKGVLQQAYCAGDFNAVIRLGAQMEAIPVMRAERELVKLEPLDWTWTTHQQRVVRDAFLRGHALVYGDRQTGKTLIMFASWIALNEFADSPRNLVYVNTSQDKSIGILDKMMNDPVLPRVFKDRVRDYMSPRAEIPSGATFQVAPAKPGALKGPTKHVIVTDDVDSLLREKTGPAVLAAAVAQARAQPDARLWFLSNNASGSFKTLRDALSGLGDRFPVLTLEQTHSPFLSEADQDEIVSAVMEATMGREYVMSQLYNLDVRTEGEWFDPDRVEDAFCPVDLPREFSRVVVGVDVGFEHPTGCVAVGEKAGQLFELDSWEEPHLTPTEVVAKIKRLHDAVSERYFNGRKVKILMESNSGGKGMGLELRRAGLRVAFSNFVDDLPRDPGQNPSSSAVPKRHVIGALMKLMDRAAVHLRNKKLKGELLRYCGDKTMDDLADALFHAVYELTKPGWLPVA